MKKITKTLLKVGIPLFAITTAVAVPLIVECTKEKKVNLSDISIQINEVLLKYINQNWTDINNKNEVIENIKNDLNSLLSNYNISVNNVNIDFENGTGDNEYKLAMPVTIEFNKKVECNSTEFEVVNETQLITTKPIQTGIHNMMSEEGVNISEVQTSIYDILINNISVWADLNLEGDVLNTIETEINETVAKFGISVKNISFELEMGSNGYKLANVNLEFSHNIIGSYENFNIENGILVTKEPIETKIYNYMTTSGFDFSDIDTDLYKVITDNVNKQWTVIDLLDTKQTTLLEQLNAIIEPLFTSITSVEIQLIDNVETSWKDAQVNITFKDKITGVYENFVVAEDSYTLSLKTPIETGISIYYLQGGQITLPIEALNKLKITLDEICSKYWTVDDGYPVVGMGDNFNLAVQEINLALPTNFPAVIQAIGPWGGNEGGIYNGPNGTKKVNITTNFYKDGVQFNNFVIPEDQLSGIYKKPWTEPGDSVTNYNIVWENVSTAVKNN